MKNYISNRSGLILKNKLKILLFSTLVFLLCAHSLSSAEYIFDIYFRGISGGNASLVVDYQDDTIISSFIIHSSGLVDRLFRVRDTTFTIASYPDFFTISFDKRIHEGSYHARRTFHVDHVSHLSLEKPVRDEYSALVMLLDSLYFNTDSIEVNLWNRKDSTTVPIVLYRGPIDYINSPAGTFPCHKYEPDKTFRSVFKNESDLVIWISETYPPLPIQMQIRLKYGFLNCILRKAVP